MLAVVANDSRVLTVSAATGGESDRGARSWRLWLLGLQCLVALLLVFVAGASAQIESKGGQVLASPTDAPWVVWSSPALVDIF